jgi:hypothetical protein
LFFFFGVGVGTGSLVLLDVSGGGVWGLNHGLLVFGRFQGQTRRINDFTTTAEFVFVDRILILRENSGWTVGWVSTRAE